MTAAGLWCRIVSVVRKILSRRG